MTTKEHFTRKEAALFLRSIGFFISAGTLRRLAYSGTGPTFSRFGWRTISYSRQDLLDWAEQRRVKIR